LLKIQQHSVTCAYSISQFAALAAIRSKSGDESVKEMVNEFEKRRDVIVNGLNEIGLRCSTPGGAFYVFVNTSPDNDVEFCQRLLNEVHIVATPGSAFGPSGKNYVRFSYATSIEDILEGLRRIRMEREIK
jgi:aspartate aminotransferase